MIMRLPIECLGAIDKRSNCLKIKFKAKIEGQKKNWLPLQKEHSQIAA
ncbi:hypothetical protein [Legionella bozemanae]|nr:hypothetical protein [Legionella bozemanae]